MPAPKKKTISNKITVDKKMKDFSKDPFVIKKTEDAKAFLKKNGLPEWFVKKYKLDVIVDTKLKAPINDPYFKKKAADAKAFLKKNGLPFQKKKTK
jgi:hypothetical protein